MTRKIGLEKEYFIETSKGEIVDPEAMWLLPTDDCGFLVEARGEPDSDVYRAVYNLLAEEMRILDTIKRRKQLKGCKLRKVPNMTFTIADVLKFYNAGKIKGKAPVYSLDGKVSKTDVKNKTAGLHIHFTNTNTWNYGKKTIVTSKQLNIPHIIRQLDEAFKDEIKKSKRPFGVYRIKVYPDEGEGFEYRSLPNNVSIKKVIAVLRKLDW